MGQCQEKQVKTNKVVWKREKSSKPGWKGRARTHRPNQCVCVYTYVYIGIYTDLYIHICTYVYIERDNYMYMCAHTLTRAHTHRQIYMVCF